MHSFYPVNWKLVLLLFIFSKHRSLSKIQKPFICFCQGDFHAKAIVPPETCDCVESNCVSACLYTFSLFLDKTNEKAHSEYNEMCFAYL